MKNDARFLYLHHGVRWIGEDKFFTKNDTNIGSDEHM